MRKRYIVTYVDALKDDGAGNVKTNTAEVLAETDKEAAAIVYASLPSGKRPSDIIPVMEVDADGKKTGKIAAYATPVPRAGRKPPCECGKTIEPERRTFDTCATCAKDAVATVKIPVFIDPPMVGRDDSVGTYKPRKLRRPADDLYVDDLGRIGNRQYRPAGSRQNPLIRTIPTVQAPDIPPDPEGLLGQTIRYGATNPAGNSGTQRPFSSAIRDRSPEYVADGSAGHWTPDTPTGKPSKH